MTAGDTRPSRSQAPAAPGGQHTRPSAASRSLGQPRAPQVPRLRPRRPAARRAGRHVARRALRVRVRGARHFRPGPSWRRRRRLSGEVRRRRRGRSGRAGTRPGAAAARGGQGRVAEARAPHPPRPAPGPAGGAAAAAAREAGRAGRGARAARGRGPGWTGAPSPALEGAPCRVPPGPGRSLPPVGVLPAPPLPSGAGACGPKGGSAARHALAGPGAAAASDAQGVPAGPGCLVEAVGFPLLLTGATRGV